MSQVLDHTSDGVIDDHLDGAAPHSPPPVPVDPAFDFDYKPVPVLAPTAAVLAACSLTAWFILPAVGIALIGTVVGVIAYRKIATSDGELGGARLAGIALAVSGFMFVGGTAKHAYVIATEVPEGFTKVNFAHDISVHGVNMERGKLSLAEDVAALVDQRIFTKGYIFPMEQTEGLTSFVLVKDNQLCCFGKEVAVTDMILVELPEGMTFDYTTTMVSVGGTFGIEPTQVEGQQNPVVYRLDAEIVEKSKTIF